MLPLEDTDLFLDFESYYDDQYSLKKLSIEEYVRDPRFEVHMMAIAKGDDPIQIVAPEDIKATLERYHVADPNTRVFIQNAKFDAFIVNQCYGLVIANPICTRCMERWTGMSRMCRESLEAQSEFLGTGEKGTYVHDAKGKRLTDYTPEELKQYRAYCAKDVELLRANVRLMLPKLTQEALKFIALSIKMYTEPIFVLDKDILQNYQAKIETDHMASLQRLQALFSFASVDDFLQAIRSADKFSSMLEQLGAKVPMKLSAAKTATLKRKLEEAQNSDPEARRRLREGDYKVYTPALAKNDLAFMQLLKDPNPDIAALAQARAENNTSIASSRCARFLSIAERGTLPVSLEAFATHTGRFAAGTSDAVKSDSTNLQNLSKRGSDKTLRMSVKAPAGYKLIACDSAQIEARTLAWLAGEQWLLKAFRDKTDPYCEMASSIYRESYETIYSWTKGANAHAPDADAELKAKYKQYRNVGKTAVLQLGYYAGAGRFGAYLQQQGITLGDSQEEHERKAQHVVNVYRGRNGAICEFWRKCGTLLENLRMGRTGTFVRGLFKCSGQYDIFGHKAPAIVLPDGFPLVYPNLRLQRGAEGKQEYVYDSMEKGSMVTKRIHSGIVCNNIVQATAFAIIRYQACLINERYPIRINIHDSLGVLAPKDEAEECLAFMQQCMRQLPPWAEDLPIDCEAEIGDDFLVA